MFVGLKVSEDEGRMLDTLVEQTNTNRSELLRRGLRLVAQAHEIEQPATRTPARRRLAKKAA